MKAVVFHGVGDIRLEDVDDPQIEQPTDAIVRLTASAVCGTDLQLVRGTLAGMRPGTILGHEGVGIVEEVGDDVRNLALGDRVVIPSTIACGNCHFCREGVYAQCDQANPHGPGAGTAFFGGPASTGPFHGLQAELARVPFANVGPVKLPDEVSDEQAIMLSDIFPTGWFGADLAGIRPGRTVAVFGCGPVGQFAIASARLMGAGRIFAVDTVPARLEMAREQGAESIDFNEEDPVEAIKRLTAGFGVDRAIEAVGVDAVRPHAGSGADADGGSGARTPGGEQRHAESVPSQALIWAVEALAKAGTLAIIGVYPETARAFPIGKALMKNLELRMGTCNHRKYIPGLIEKVMTREIDPTRVLTQVEPLTSVLEAYHASDARQPWSKIELQPLM